MRIPSVVLSLFFLTSGLLHAQQPKVDADGYRRVADTKPSPQSQQTRAAEVNRIVRAAATRRSGGEQKAASPVAFTKNITLNLSGQLGDGIPMEVSMTGCGNEFISEGVVAGKGENPIPTIVSLHFVVTPADVGFTVEYTVGARVPIITSQVGGAKKTTSSSVSFEEVMVRGTVKCPTGESVRVYKNGEQSLTLLVTQ